MNAERDEFLASVIVTEWVDLYAEELLAKYWGVVSGFAEVLS